MTRSRLWVNIFHQQPCNYVKLYSQGFIVIHSSFCVCFYLHSTVFKKMLSGMKESLILLRLWKPTRHCALYGWHNDHVHRQINHFCGCGGCDPFVWRLFSLQGVSAGMSGAIKMAEALMTNQTLQTLEWVQILPCVNLTFVLAAYHWHALRQFSFVS